MEASFQDGQLEPPYLELLILQEVRRDLEVEIEDLAHQDQDPTDQGSYNQTICPTDHFSFLPSIWNHIETKL